MCILLEATFEVDYEEAIDTSEQLVNKGIKLMLNNYDTFWIKRLSDSTDPWHKRVANNSVIAQDGYHYTDLMKYGILRDGTHAMIDTHLVVTELALGFSLNQGMGWYRSKQTIGNNPGLGYLTNKMWAFNEADKIAIIIKLR